MPPTRSEAPRLRRARRVLPLSLLAGLVLLLIRTGSRALGSAPAGTMAHAAPVVVDLEHAPEWSLRLLPGIGRVRARALVGTRSMQERWTEDAAAEGRSSGSQPACGAAHAGGTHESAALAAEALLRSAGIPTSLLRRWAREPASPRVLLRGRPLRPP